MVVSEQWGVKTGDTERAYLSSHTYRSFCLLKEYDLAVSDVEQELRTGMFYILRSFFILLIAPQLIFL